MSKKLMILGALVAALAYTLTGCGQAMPTVAKTTAKQVSAKTTQGELLVKFKAQVTTSSVQIFHAQHGTRTLRVIPGLNIHVVTVTTKEPLAKVLAKVAKSPMVEYAETNHSFNLNEDQPLL